MKRMYKKLIIFDLDGTLVDSGRDLAGSINHTLRYLGSEPLPLTTILSRVGNGVSILIEEGLGKEGERLLGDALNIFLRHYEQHLLDTTTVYPGVHEALKYHEGSFRFALLTNKPLYLTEIILRDLSLDALFKPAVGGDSPGMKKPDPRGVLRILEETGTRSGEAVIVGDSINDVLAGRGSGVEVVGAGYGLGARDFSLHPPDHLIDTFPELFEIVGPV